MSDGTRPQEHTVSTTRAQDFIKSGYRLAQVCDGAGHVVPFADVHPEYPAEGNSFTIDALEKAVADLRHAAEELDAERLSLKGWPQ